MWVYDLSSMILLILKIRLPSLGADLNHLEAFLELPSHGKVCAGARELTKYGLYKVENCQEHVQFWLQNRTKIVETDYLTDFESQN